MHGRHARRGRGAAARADGVGEPAQRHQDAFALLAQLDRDAIVEDGADERRVADRAVVAVVTGQAQSVGRRFRTHDAGAVRALPARARGMRRHRGAAVRTVHLAENSARITSRRRNWLSTLVANPLVDAQAYQRLRGYPARAAGHDKTVLPIRFRPAGESNSCGLAAPRTSAHRRETELATLSYR